MIERNYRSICSFVLKMDLLLILQLEIITFKIALIFMFLKACLEAGQVNFSAMPFLISLILIAVIISFVFLFIQVLELI